MIHQSGPKKRKCDSAHAEGRGDWGFRLGRFEVRASCPNHPNEVLARTGMIATCPACTMHVVVCGQTFGSKECVRNRGHAGVHASRSGSAWPDENIPREPLGSSACRLQGIAPQPPKA